MLYVGGLDQNGNLIKLPANTTCGLVVASNPSGGLISGTYQNVQVTSSAGGGLAFFTPIFDKAGTYTLQATCSAGLPVVSTPFTVVAASPAQLQISTQPPANLSSGGTFSTSVTLTDSFGNPIPSGTVTVSASGGTLGGSTSAIVTNGSATFTNLSMTSASGGSYTLTFSSGGNGFGVAVTSSAIVVAPAVVVPTGPLVSGGSFNTINQLTTFNNALYLATDGGIFKSTDGAVTFVRQPGPSFVYNLQFINGSIFALSSGALMISNDGGASYTATNLFYSQYNTGQTSYSLSMQLYKGTIYLSGPVDTGPEIAPWTPAGTLTTYVNNYNNGASGGFLWESTDNGATFKQVKLGYIDTAQNNVNQSMGYVGTLYLDQNNQNSLGFLDSEGAVWSSTDGATFLQISPRGSILSIFALNDNFFANPYIGSHLLQILPYQTIFNTGDLSGASFMFASSAGYYAGDCDSLYFAPNATPLFSQISDSTYGKSGDCASYGVALNGSIYVTSGGGQSPNPPWITISSNGGATFVTQTFRQQPIAPIVDLFTGYYAANGDLEWTISGATSVTVSDGTHSWSQQENLIFPAITSTTTYTLTASNSVGQTSAQFTLSVPSKVAFLTQPPSKVTVGQTGLSASIQLLDASGNPAPLFNRDISSCGLNVSSAPPGFTNLGSNVQKVISSSSITYSGLVFNVAGTYILEEDCSDVNGNDISVLSSPIVAH